MRRDEGSRMNRAWSAGFQPALWAAGILPGRLLFIFVVVLVSHSNNSAIAQDYLFSVPRADLDVTVLTNGGAILEYDMDFENAPGAHPIDIVDIGMPNEEYGLNEMEAWSGDTKLSDIRQSQYVHPGVEVHLDSKTIAPGESGNLKFRGSAGNLVFQDTTRDDYASMQITPTWFDGKYVRGNTRLTIRIHLPKGVTAEEVVFQDVPFTGKQFENDSVVVSWEAKRGFTSAYRVGVSFPKRVMERIVTMTMSELLMRWWKGTFSINTRIGIGIAAIVALGIIFFRFTGGTGGCIFFILLIITGISYSRHETTEILIWPVLIVLGVVVETTRRRRKSKYLPAIASVEGGGIKRGLTAPEAGMLLEMPLNKVVTLILFGMMKKGLIRQINQDPVRFSVEPKPPADAILQEYEKDVLSILKDSGKAVGQYDFSEVTSNLMHSVVQKMKGFDLNETREYYKQIISRAWTEARAIGNVEEWQKKMDEKVDWMILDPGFNDRFRPYNDRYIPRSYRTTAGPSVGSMSKPSGGFGTRFSDVAGSVSGWLQNTASGVVTKIEGKEGGLVSFAAMDKAVSKAMASSGSGGGRSGGGGCACACAGCACACACAGGGR